MLQFLFAVLVAFRVFVRSRADTALEILALRQQVAVLKRRRPRPPLNSGDRLFWITLRRLVKIKNRHYSQAILCVNVYRGELDDPKTDSSTRTAAVPPKTAALLRHWLEMAVSSDPEAFVFAGETGKPLWRDALLTDHIKPKLKPYGLDWVDFQVMRRTHATLSHKGPSGIYRPRI